MVVRMSTTSQHVSVLVLDHLPVKHWIFITIAYGIQVKHTLVCWNDPLSIAKENVFRILEYK